MKLLYKYTVDGTKYILSMEFQNRKGQLNMERLPENPEYEEYIKKIHEEIIESMGIEPEQLTKDI